MSCKTDSTQSSYGFHAYCGKCGWLGPLRTLLFATYADRIDHLVTSAGAPPIVVGREPTWSFYP